MTYGLKGFAPGCMEDASQAEPNMYEVFRESLDHALGELTESRGECFRAAEKSYNDLWPDGATVCIERNPDDSFTARFSTGELLEFRDYEDLGAALLVMRDSGLFQRIRAENREMTQPDA